MKKLYQFLFFLCFLPGLGFAQETGLKLREASVTTLTNTITTLDIPDNKLLLVITLGPDCPISQKYIPVLERLRESFQDNLQIVGVFPAYFSVHEVASFKEDYALKFPCYIDHDMNVIKLLHARVTPEVFLFSTGLALQYSGAIDNWFYDLGRYRTEITQHYLADAIESLLHGTKVNQPNTEAIGCLIQDTKKSGKTEHMHH